MAVVYVPNERKPRKKNPRTFHLGKRTEKLEEAWCDLPLKDRSEASFVALAVASGIAEEKARRHFRLCLGILQKGLDKFERVPAPELVAVLP